MTSVSSVSLADIRVTLVQSMLGLASLTIEAMAQP
jgi:hypothetical protein